MRAVRIVLGNARRGLLLFQLMLNVATAFAGAPSTPPPLSHGQVFEEQGGAALYASVCAGCHQPDARGAGGAADYPALEENKSLASADYVEGLLLHGQRGMPPVGQMMSDQQIADVINYVRTHFGNAYGDGVSAADVAAARRKTAP